MACAAALAAMGCATRDPMPFATAKDCFYPACSLDVEVVDDGAGGKKIKVEADGNVRMGTRHRVVAIVWRLRTPGYEMRYDSIRPHTGRSTPGKESTPRGVWESQMFPSGYSGDYVSITNLNTERVVMHYDIKLYPLRGLSGEPITLDPAIMNDP